MHLSSSKPSLKTPENVPSDLKLVQSSEKICHRYWFGIIAAWKLELIAKATGRHQGEIIEEYINNDWELKEEVIVKNLSQKKISQVLIKKLRMAVGQ